MLRRRWIPLLTVLLLAVAGVTSCGGDDDSGSGDDQDESSTKAADANDQELADRIVLKLSDFPSGWTEDDSTDEDDDDEDPLADCLGEESDELTDAETAEAESPDFSRGEATTASSLVSLLKTEPDAERGMELIRSEKLKQCLNEAMDKELRTQTGEEGVEIGEVSLKNSSFPNVADETAALQMQVPITVQGSTVSFYADIVFFREGRIVAGLMVADVGQPFPSAEAEALARKLAGRMKAA
jgi:hypothetical protein